MNTTYISTNDNDLNVSSQQDTLAYDLFHQNNKKTHNKKYR